MNKIFRSISFKLGLLFSTVFLFLLLLLGYTLYELFSQMFIDYIAQDLLIRGKNHAEVLARNYNEITLKHVALMEKNVVTNVVVTNQNQQVIISSDEIDKGIEKLIAKKTGKIESKILNQDWKHDQYIAAVSPIDQGKLGYVYMFYPAKLIKETVLVLKGFIVIASIGVVFMAIGGIVILSRKITNPLLEMKKATKKMADGDYKQKLHISGKDEIAQLGYAIQILGEKLQYYEDTRNEFLSSISHELRTPITYIKGYSDVLIKGLVKEKEEQIFYLKVINEETKRVSELINDLFDMAKIQTGQFSLEKEEIDMIPLIQKMMKSLSPVAEEKNIQFIFEKYVDKLQVYVDPKRMEQVFFNLIENAIKYTAEGEVRVIVQQDKESYKINIKDTGSGIPKEEISNIFDRFYRVEKSRARNTGGTGLGLFVVKEIIQLHEGQINVQSTERKGTTFTIILPKRDGSYE